MSDIENTVGNGEEGPLRDRSQKGPSGIRSGRAIFFFPVVQRGRPPRAGCPDFLGQPPEGLAVSTASIATGPASSQRPPLPTGSKRAPVVA